MNIEEQARALLAGRDAAAAKTEADSLAALARLEPDLREFAAFMRSHNVPTKPVRVNPRVVAARGLFRRREVEFDHVGDGWEIHIIGEGSSQYIVTMDARLFSFVSTSGGGSVPRPVAQIKPYDAATLREALVKTVSWVLRGGYSSGS